MLTLEQTRRGQIFSAREEKRTRNKKRKERKKKRRKEASVGLFTHLHLKCKVKALTEGSIVVESKC